MVRCVQYSISDEKGKRTRPVDSAPAKEYDRGEAHNQVPVGFVTHLPEQEELFRTTFGG